ncbi:hypothetical protein [Iamia sp.]|uniref:hypothetical protein n=1 Tax=Iamia sp. TaxID=2722710 RepID=UPI002C91BABB|nr:hypothetical protein [Iamia sp.]HXH59525.1 hypothetical protein [Iamia sp.]
MSVPPAERPSVPDTPLRGLLVLASLGAAAIHFAYAPTHLAANTVHGAFFVLVAWFQLGWALAVGLRPSRALFGLGAVVNVGVIGVWLVSRSIGISGETEALGFPDSAATALAGVVIIGSFARAAVGLPRRRFPEAGTGAFLGASAVAVAALVSASMVPSLSGGHGPSGEGEGGHHGSATEVDATGVVDEGNTDAVATGDDGQGAAAAGHGDAGSEGHEDVVAVPFDPELPIDLGGTEGVTPQEQAEAENIIAVTLLRLPQWADAATAEDAGFRSIGDGATGVEHFINQEFMDDDAILDPDRPESLVYDTEGGGRRLVAAMYMTEPGTPLEDVPDLGGDLMQWHVHDDLCYNAEGKVAGITNAEGECPAGLVKPEETPMIHVWIQVHPCGPFAALEGIGAGRIAEGEERLCDEAHGG